MEKRVIYTPGSFRDTLKLYFSGVCTMLLCGDGIFSAFFCFSPRTCESFKGVHEGRCTKCKTFRENVRKMHEKYDENTKIKCESATQRERNC
eukprot:TRINITY_DN4966_c0_g1_i1.p1 TRINITY_DN4966_c0_g1~~TRINITY_DN4966_c0_g1_i1.p1  ORF type:complete len:92 (+),score=10.11 TRINITY_DN4966_c0_g1_i1:110-385(+)